MQLCIMNTIMWLSHLTWHIYETQTNMVHINTNSLTNMRFSLSRSAVKFQDGDILSDTLCYMLC